MFSLTKTNILPLAAVFVLLLSAFNLSAAVLTVTTLADTDDAVCDAQCSLREALTASTGGDTIIFARDLRGGTIQLTKTLLIQRRITIDGPNLRRITVKGDNTFRIIETRTDGTSAMVISIDGLIMRDGQALAGDGGGILVGGSGTVLNLTNCAILGNTAQHGGGIYMPGGTLYLIDSTLADNTSTADGSAGGIDLHYTIVKIMNSTISGNKSLSAVDGVGGIRLYSSPNWFINGGTVAGNSSNGAELFSVGGIGNIGGINGSITNSIIAKNTGIRADFTGGGTSARNSLFGIGSPTGTFTDGVNGNIVGTAKAPVDPQIGLLNDNGGGLPTHALLPASRAIDAGNTDLSIDRHGKPLTIDQRGYSRIVNTTVDIGAYEFNAAPLNPASNINGRVTNATRSAIFGARILLRDETGAIRFAMVNPSGFYRFAGVPANATYTIECVSKRDTFSPQNILVEESTEYIDFRAN
ncbi:MAG: choice-of-anchor Q domain-containing protein [Pyrinomonadaceae bacterium]